jgi:hypothetical protein
MTQKGVLFILVVLAAVYTQGSYSTSKLFVPALHALTGIWALIGGTTRCTEDAQEARRCIEDAQEARNRSGTPCQQRPTRGVGPPRWDPLLGGVSGLRDI